MELNAQKSNLTISLVLEVRSSELSEIWQGSMGFRALTQKANNTFSF